eukprot:s1486_g3.t1
MSAAAYDLIGLICDAQTARNAVVPDDFGSPVVALLAMAMSSALDHLLLYPGCPLRFLSPQLVDLATTFGDGIRYDRLQYALKLAVEEIECYDGFAPLRVIKDSIGMYQTQMQQALADRAPALHGLHPAELDAAQ